MPWRDAVLPAAMVRVAVVAPTDRARAVLCEVADAGMIELERDSSGTGPARQARDRQRRRAATTTGAGAAPELQVAPVDPGSLEDLGDLAALAGEAELEEVRAAAVDDGTVTAAIGWMPAAGTDDLAARLAAEGGGLVRLAGPRGAQPPTLLLPSPARTFQPLVDTYTTLPYRDLNPSLAAGVTYVLMFGMMFGDVGHGAVLLATGIALRCWRGPRLGRLRWAAPFLIGAALASIAFGFAYGEAFGPTGAVPTLWLAPLDHPTALLAVAVVAGACLLTLAFALGSLNRWREAAGAGALSELSGLAGMSMYLGLLLLALGWWRHLVVVAAAGGVLAGMGLVAAFTGLFVRAGGRASGALQAGVETFDGVVRLGTNTVSFARLAAFGLTHAALTAAVWTGTLALVHRGGGGLLAGVVLFLVGNALAFALEALVSGIQALRLEYYELFSRVLAADGRAFRPWHVPTRLLKET